MTAIKLGVPSKGRLQDDTIRWFAERGVAIRRTGSGREYAGVVDGVDGVELALLSAGEIPRELAAGRIRFGVTGQDMVRERIPAWPDKVTEVTEMGFGHATLVIAVPAFWSDAETLDDLDAIASAFRRRHGYRLRIATKYHTLVREFLRQAGVADYQLVDSQGATEGTILNRTAEAIADITSSGATLRDNNLKELRGGEILKSQATLFESRVIPLSDEGEQIAAAFRARVMAANARVS